jgi:hypothetical protein
MTENPKYIFHGRIYPERTNVYLEPGFTVESDNTRINVKITASQIVAEAEFGDEIENIHTMRNTVEESVYNVTDLFSFVEGYSYTVEITSVVTPDGESHVFGVTVPALREKSEDMNMSDQVTRILGIQSELDSDYLHRCFKDLRLSMKDPAETGFFCYRSIETVRKYFQNKYEIDDKKEGWIKMRNELEIERSKIDSIKEYADDRRHGGQVTITGEERADLFSNTWKILDQFLSYLEKNMSDD